MLQALQAAAAAVVAAVLTLLAARRCGLGLLLSLLRLQGEGTGKGANRRLHLASSSLLLDRRTEASAGAALRHTDPALLPSGPSRNVAAGRSSSACSFFKSFRVARSRSLELPPMPA